MKQRSTTPVSASPRLATNAVIVACAVLMMVATPLSMMPKVSADDPYQAKINSLQREISQYQSEASKLNGTATTLQAELSVVQNEVRTLQSKVVLTQTRVQQLNDEIAQKNDQLQKNRDAMGTIMADLYVDNSISPLEMLASSNNIGDYVDKQSYRSTVRDNLTKMIKEINTLRQELETSKKSVESQLAQQKLQEGELVAKQTQQNDLLEKTKGEEANYRQLASARQADLAKEQAARQEFFAELSRQANKNSGGGGLYNNETPIAVGNFQMRNITPLVSCGGGYPGQWCGPMNSAIDNWGLYSRQCVSYSAWRATQMGKRVGNFSGQGNAYQWPSSAGRWMGATVNTTPAVGAVAVLPATSPVAPGFGHTMNVEAILPDGWIRVSQYNYGGTGMYNQMDIRPAGVTFVHFPNS